MRPRRLKTFTAEQVTQIIAIACEPLENSGRPIDFWTGRELADEFEYKRHGTQCLIGNWDVVAGQMMAPTIRETRTNTDFMWHIFHTVQTDPNAGWVFVADSFADSLSAAADKLGLDSAA